MPAICALPVHAVPQLHDCRRQNRFSRAAPFTRDGTRTRTAKGQRILSPLRLPFRHPSQIAYSKTSAYFMAHRLPSGQADFEIGVFRKSAANQGVFGRPAIMVFGGGRRFFASKAFENFVRVRKNPTILTWKIQPPKNPSNFSLRRTRAAGAVISRERAPSFPTPTRWNIFTTAAFGPWSTTNTRTFPPKRRRPSPPECASSECAWRIRPARR